MNYGRSASAILILGIGLIALLVMLPEIVSLNETARTQTEQDVGLGCTSDTSGACTVTLTSAHEYATAIFMTVNETAPGSVDRTSTTTVQTDRTMIVVTGLSVTPTAYTFTVDFIERNALVSEGANEFLSRLPLILILGLMAVGLGGAIAAWSMFKSGGRKRR